MSVLSRSVVESDIISDGKDGHEDTLTATRQEMEQALMFERYYEALRVKIDRYGRTQQRQSSLVSNHIFVEYVPIESTLPDSTGGGGGQRHQDGGGGEMEDVRSDMAEVSPSQSISSSGPRSTVGGDVVEMQSQIDKSTVGGSGGNGGGKVEKSRSVKVRSERVGNKKDRSSSSIDNEGKLLPVSVRLKVATSYIERLEEDVKIQKKRIGNIIVSAKVRFSTSKMHRDELQRHLATFVATRKRLIPDNWQFFRLNKDQTSGRTEIDRTVLTDGLRIDQEIFRQDIQRRLSELRRLRDRALQLEMKYHQKHRRTDSPSSHAVSVGDTKILLECKRNEIRKKMETLADQQKKIVAKRQILSRLCHEYQSMRRELQSARDLYAKTEAELHRMGKKVDHYGSKREMLKKTLESAEKERLDVELVNESRWTQQPYVTYEDYFRVKCLTMNIPS